MFTAEWKRGTEWAYPDVDAQKVATEIMGIGDDATPQQIVELAKNVKTELHRCFTWDNDKAAEKWRLHEARHIVCSLVIVNEQQPEEPQVRVFHKIESGTGYRAAPLIFKDNDNYAKLLKTAMAELHAFKVKYSALSELDYILKLID